MFGVAELEGACPQRVPSPPAVKRGRYGWRSIISFGGCQSGHLLMRLTAGSVVAYAMSCRRNWGGRSHNSGAAIGLLVTREISCVLPLLPCNPMKSDTEPIEIGVLSSTQESWPVN
jgi:hypothetical protein